jgi:hypothetical protein
LPAGIEGRQIPALSPVNAARSAQSCCWHRMRSELVALCGDAGDNDPVFRSAKAASSARGRAADRERRRLSRRSAGFAARAASRSLFAPA